MARRSRRGKNALPVDVLFEAAAKLPWWAGLLLAVASFAVCHWLASTEIPKAKGIADLAPVIQTSFLKVVGSVLQFVLPLIFIFAAIASGIAQLTRAKASRFWYEPSPSEPPRAESHPASPADDVWSNRLQTNFPAMYDSEMPPQAQVDTSRWSQDLLKALEWKRFEEVCAGLFERLGFATRAATTGADGGIDIHLFRPPGEQAVAIVQCKAWTGSSKVGVRYIRELHGVMASKRITDGIFATTTVFSDDAKEYAKANHIDLLDGNAILKSISTLSDEEQERLLRVATVGDYATPTCPSCGVKMTKRNPKAGGKAFWGCVNYPRCRSIINIAKA